MCVLEKYLGIHITTRDKVDLSVTLISLADCIWFLGDIYHNTMHPHHYVVAVLLALGTVLSIRLLIKLIIKHHTTWKKKQLAIKAESLIPRCKHSEK